MSGTQGQGSVQADAQVIEAGTAEIQGQGSVTADASVQAGEPYTDQTFLAAFPEFNNASQYPYPQRQFWFNLALKNLDPNRWGDYYELGVYLFTAHHLSILGGDNRGKAGRPGQVPYPTTSKSVGSVSVGYDTSILSTLVSQGAGFWGLSMYGMRLNQLIQMVGMGGVQIGYGPLPPMSAGPGFYGPDTGYPF